MKKSKNGLMIVIVILSVIILALVGYIVYDKISEDNKSENVQNNNEEGNKNLISEDNKNENVQNNNEEGKQNVNFFDLAKEYINNIIELDTYNLFNRLYEEGLSNDIKLSMALSDLEKFEQKYTCDEVYTANYEEEYRPIGYEFYGCSVLNKEGVYSINYDQVNEDYKKLFGDMNDAPKEIAYCDNSSICDYSEKINSYVKLDIQASGNPSYEYYYEIKDVKIDNNELKITILYLDYVELMNGSFVYNLNDVDHIANNVEEVKQAYNDNKEKLPSLTFVFEKENQNYIIKSVE